MLTLVIDDKTVVLTFVTDKTGADICYRRQDCGANICHRQDFGADICHRQDQGTYISHHKTEELTFVTRDQ